MPSDDGSNRHPIYLGEPRLGNFARNVGGVRDEKILDLLGTVRGFRELVYGVGVSISATRPDMDVRFTLSCKGATPDEEGSQHSLTLLSDGVESMLLTDTLRWNDGDTALGAFLFDLPGADSIAQATVRFYLKDGWHCPHIDPDKAVDFDRQAYKDMIARSFLSAGNNRRIKRLLKRIRSGEAINLAFFGGSITQGAGAVPMQSCCYARLVFEGIRKRYAPQDGSNLGHRVMADCLMYLFDRLDRQPGMSESDRCIPPVYGTDFEGMRLLDRRDCPESVRISPGAFSDIDTVLQSVPFDYDSFNTPEFSHNWMKGAGDEPFVLELKCSRLQMIFKDSADPAFGRAVVSVDGQDVGIYDPLVAGWTHCHATIILNRADSEYTRVEVRMAPGDEDKVFTILGFGYAG